MIIMAVFEKSVHRMGLCRQVRIHRQHLERLGMLSEKRHRMVLTDPGRTENWLRDIRARPRVKPDPRIYPAQATQKAFSRSSKSDAGPSNLLRPSSST